MGLKSLVRDDVLLSVSSPDDQEGDAENQARCCLLTSDLLAEDNVLLQANRHVGASGIVGGFGKYYGGNGGCHCQVAVKPNFASLFFSLLLNHLDCRRCGEAFLGEEMRYV